MVWCPWLCAQRQRLKLLNTLKSSVTQVTCDGCFACQPVIPLHAAICLSVKDQYKCKSWKYKAIWSMQNSNDKMYYLPQLERTQHQEPSLQRESPCRVARCSYHAETAAPPLCTWLCHPLSSENHTRNLHCHTSVYASSLRLHNLHQHFLGHVTWKHEKTYISTVFDTSQRQNKNLHQHFFCTRHLQRPVCIKSSCTRIHSLFNLLRMPICRHKDTTIMVKFI